MFDHVSGGDVAETKDVVAERCEVGGIIRLLDYLLKRRLVRFEEVVLGDGFRLFGFASASGDIAHETGDTRIIRVGADGVIEYPCGVKGIQACDVDRGCIMQGDELGGFDDGGSEAELVSERERIMRCFRFCVLSRNFHSRDVHPLHGGTPAVPGEPDASEGLHVRNGGHFTCLKVRLRLLET